MGIRTHTTVQDGIIKSLPPLIILMFALIATVIVYYPALWGSFFFDDGFNIQNNMHLRIQDLNFSTLWLAASSIDIYTFGRPLSMLSFALNFYFFGEETFSFKLVNLAIHIINGLLIFFLSRQLLQFINNKKNLNLSYKKISISATLITTLWLVHPLNLTSVLYIVQRMNSLSALFVLSSLLVYLKARLFYPKYTISSILLFIVSAIFWILGMASKETAVLLPFYIFVIEFLFFYPTQKASFKTKIFTFSWLVIPLFIGFIYLVSHPNILSYSFRPFTLWERVLTETRALWFYTSLIVLPRPGALGIFHDDFLLSTTFFNPWTTLPAVLGLLLVVGFALRFSNKAPTLAFGVLFFLSAHALESSIIPLEIMHEHRNYLASFGILFGLVGYLAFTSEKKLPLQPGALISVALVFIVFFGAITHGRAINWQDYSRIVLSSVDRHPKSISANHEAGRLYLILRDRSSDWLQKDDFNEKAIYHFNKLAELAPNTATGVIGILLANATNSKPSDDALFQEAEERLQHGLVNGASSSSINFLLTLSRCERSDECFIPTSRVDALFQAVLTNTRLLKTQRATLLDELALRAAKAGKLKNAEELFKQAIDNNNINAMYRINYAGLLIHLKRFDDAQTLLEELLAKPQPKAIVEFIGELKERMKPGYTPSPSNKPTTPPEKKIDLLLQRNSEEKDQIDLLRVTP